MTSDTPTTDAQNRPRSELRSQIHATIHSQHGDEVSCVKETERLLTLFDSALQKAEREAEDRGFKEGQRVGQYQAADKLYHHVTHIWMFKDTEDGTVKELVPKWTEALRIDCEKYLNHNARVYTDYVRGDRYKRMHPESQSKKGAV